MRKLKCKKGNYFLRIIELNEEPGRSQHLLAQNFSHYYFLMRAVAKVYPLVSRHFCSTSILALCLVLGNRQKPNPISPMLMKTNKKKVSTLISHFMYTFRISMAKTLKEVRVEESAELHHCAPFQKHLIIYLLKNKLSKMY